MIANPETIAYLRALTDDESEYQRDILQAREYDSGMQFIALTDRLRLFLGGDTANTSEDWKRLRLNVCRIVLSSVVERLIVAGFDSDETATEAGVKATASWAWKAWERNRMDARQRRVHEATLRDSESFVIVDWDNARNLPRFTPHLRYTSGGVGGDGMGCRAFYRNDDPDQELLYVTKRWYDVRYGPAGRESTPRLTIYYPDRIERYSGAPGAEKQYGEAGQPWPIPWLHKDGTPLGIPVAHFRSSAGMEAREAFPLQNAINKALVDLMRESDMSAFRILIALGWEPVDAAGQPLTIEPGTWVGSSSKDAKVGEIKGADLNGFLNLIDSLLYKVATVTDTPVSRFIASRQVSAEGTQKEQNGPLLNKIRNRAGELGNGWEDALHIAARLHNTFSTEPAVNETVELMTQWDALDVRDEAAELLRAEAYDKLGLPIELIAPVLGLTPKQAAIWQAEKDARRALAQTKGSNDGTTQSNSDRGTQLPNQNGSGDNQPSND